MIDELRDELTRAFDGVGEHDPDGHNFLSPSRAADAALPIIARAVAAGWDQGAEYGLQRGMGDYDSWILSDNPHREPYTPTIADVQSYYVLARRRELPPQPQDLTPLSCEFDRALKAEVVRRIAEAKAEVKAEALEDLAKMWERTASLRAYAMDDSDWAETKQEGENNE